MVALDTERWRRLDGEAILKSRQHYYLVLKDPASLRGGCSFSSRFFDMIGIGAGREAGGSR